MKDYCNCDTQRIEETFLSGGVIFCVGCRQPVCCDVALIDSAVEPHPAEFGEGQRFGCWAHRSSLANLVLFKSGSSGLIH